MTMRHIERIEVKESATSFNVFRVGGNVRLDVIQPPSGIVTQDFDKETAVRIANALLSAAGY